MREKPKKPEYKGRTYNQWVNVYNKGQASYENYLIARKILVDGINEEQAIKEVEDARTKEE